MALHWLDWLVIAAYLVFAVVTGFVLRKRASSAVDQYFLSGRSLPWWLAGTSMVATSFAADTPLVVSGWVRDYGIWKNWLWWSYAISGVLSVFLFARWWRRGEVMTKAEIIEVRYHGRAAGTLRGLLGLLHAFVTNTMVLCWVLLAASKILDAMFGIPKFYSVTLACAIAMSYALLAGFWGVVVTDFVQFIISMVGAVALAAICYSAVGGADGIQAAAERGEAFAMRSETLRLFPVTESTLPWDPQFWTVSIAALAVYLGVAWWAVETVDGGGHAIQRIAASKDDREGMLATLWYNIAHYGLRPWPWIIVGVASLVVLPRLEVESPVAGEVVNVTQDSANPSVFIQPDDGSTQVSIRLEDASQEPDWQPHLPTVSSGDHVDLGQVIGKSDSEQAYIVMLGRYLPLGIKGLVVASLLAAFMSTVDTHVNLAASYFVNDIYRRYLIRTQSERHYVTVARLASVAIMVLSGVLAFSSRSISGIFEFFLAFLAGVGPVYAFRWLWWRVTAVTEITALIASGAVATFLTYAPIQWQLGPFSTNGQLEPAGRLLLVVLCSLAASLLSLLIAPKPNPQTLVGFYKKVRPMGWWKPVAALAPEVQRVDSLAAVAVGTIGGLALIFGVLFGTGCMLLGSGGLTLSAVATAVGIMAVAWSLRRLDYDVPEGSALS